MYDRQRNLFIDKIVSRSPSFANLDDVQKLRYIVDLDCPPEVINQCCKFIAEIYALRERQSTANSWWSNITYILEIINLLVSIIWVFFVLVFWSSYLTLSSTNVVHLDIRVIFLYVCYDLCVLLVKLTSVLVMQIKILNLENLVSIWWRHHACYQRRQRQQLTTLVQLSVILLANISQGCHTTKSAIWATIYFTIDTFINTKCWLSCLMRIKCYPRGVCKGADLTPVYRVHQFVKS